VKGTEVYAKQMRQATFRFYAELNEFLPEDLRHTRITHHFEGSVSIREMIESLGIPHNEIDLILVNDNSVDFTYLVQDRDRVTVYPVFETFDISSAARVRRKPLRDLRFVLDAHLGRLALYLRLLGFDAIFNNDSSDGELVTISLEENRILLARDQSLIERGQVTHGYWVRNSRPREQAAEVVRRFDLQGQIAPFRRCARCNTLLETAGRKTGAPRLSDRTRERRDSPKRCPRCARSYRRGAHSERIRKLVRLIVEGAG
jgi:uncharacterized protein with PIN domain